VELAFAKCDGISQANASTTAIVNSSSETKQANSKSNYQLKRKYSQTLKIGKRQRQAAWQSRTSIKNGDSKKKSGDGGQVGHGMAAKRISNIRQGSKRRRSISRRRQAEHIENIKMAKSDRTRRAIRSGHGASA